MNQAPRKISDFLFTSVMKRHGFIVEKLAGGVKITKGKGTNKTVALYRFGFMFLLGCGLTLLVISIMVSRFSFLPYIMGLIIGSIPLYLRSAKVGSFDQTGNRTIVIEGNTIQTEDFQGNHFEFNDLSRAKLGAYIEPHESVSMAVIALNLDDNHPEDYRLFELFSGEAHYLADDVEIVGLYLKKILEEAHGTNGVSS